MDLFRIAIRLATQPNRFGIRHEDKSNKFDWNEFKNLNSANEMNEYAGDKLKKLGQGSSRACYLLSGSKVLKIAISFRGRENGAGTAQNRAEVDMYTNPKTKQICTKIFDTDHEFRWILSELVRPINNNHEFESLAGVSMNLFGTLAQFILADGLSSKRAYDLFVEEFHFYRSEPITDQDKESCKSAIKILEKLKGFGLEYEDLVVLEHWGKSASGNLVLLDYGLTTGIYKEFYLEHGTGT
jgi:hypothetical protein